MRIFISVFFATLLIADNMIILERPNKRVPYSEGFSNERSLTGEEVYYPYGDKSRAKIATGRLIVSFYGEVDIEKFATMWNLSEPVQISSSFNSWIFKANGSVLRTASEIGKLDNIRYATPEWQTKRELR